MSYFIWAQLIKMFAMKQGGSPIWPALKNLLFNLCAGEKKKKNLSVGLICITDNEQ